MESEMLKLGDILDFGPLGMKMTIKKTAAETDGRLFEVEMELGPRTGGTPVHTHPQAVETFEVLQGQFDLFVRDAWRTLGEG
jgi:quercetin dioxygenase-like cupin family protein